MRVIPLAYFLRGLVNFKESAEKVKITPRGKKKIKGKRDAKRLRLKKG